MHCNWFDSSFSYSIANILANLSNLAAKIYLELNHFMQTSLVPQCKLFLVLLTAVVFQLIFLCLALTLYFLHSSPGWNHVMCSFFFLKMKVKFLKVTNKKLHDLAPNYFSKLVCCYTFPCSFWVDPICYSSSIPDVLSLALVSVTVGTDCHELGGLKYTDLLSTIP